MKHTKKWIHSILYAFLMISFLFTNSIAYAVDEIPFIILSQYQEVPADRQIRKNLLFPAASTYLTITLKASTKEPNT